MRDKMIKKVLMGVAGMFIASGCVPLEGLEGHPCPCPEGRGLTCCTLSQTCLHEDKECPNHYPPSSGAPCGCDDDCPQGEICQAWRGINGELAGPQECRSSCSPGNLCAEGEDCRPTLHDGLLASLLSISHACVGKKPPLGCEQLACIECQPEDYGRTYCESDGVVGCFFTINIKCGLVCRKAKLEDCEPGFCEEKEDEAHCQKVDIEQNPCPEFSCENCDYPAPGQSVCIGDSVVSCMVLPYEGQSCEELCVVVEQPCAQDQICSDDVSDCLENPKHETTECWGWCVGEEEMLPIEICGNQEDDDKDSLIDEIDCHGPDPECRADQDCYPGEICSTQVNEPKCMM